MKRLIPYRILDVHILASQAFYTMELVTMGNNHVNNTMPHMEGSWGLFLAIDL